MKLSHSNTEFHSRKYYSLLRLQFFSLLPHHAPSTFNNQSINSYISQFFGRMLRTIYRIACLKPSCTNQSASRKFHSLGENISQSTYLSRADVH
jgi:hypothetical protein